MTATFFLVALLSITAHAHHGLDFMLLQDGTIPKPGSFMLFDNTEWATFNGEDEWGTEPGLHLGVTPWLAIGTTASIMDEGNGWHYLSTTPYLNLPLFKSDRVPWLRVSLYAGYEFPDNVARISGTSSKQRQTAKRFTNSSSNTLTSPSSINTGTDRTKQAVSSTKKSVNRGSTGRHVTGGGTVPGGGPDGPGTGGTQHNHPVATPSAAPNVQRSTNATATETTTTPVIVAAPMETPYLGIHRHGEEGLHARLIIDVELSENDKIIGNIINFTPRDGTPAWGYAVGYRHAFYHDLAASLEAIGDFDGRGSHEVLIAAHYTLSHSLTLKLGASAGLTEDSPDASIHAGVVWRF